MVGPITPPAGGISIHIERLVSLLQHEFIFDYIDEARTIKKEYFNIRELNVFKYIKKFKNADLIYIHSGNKFLKKIHILIGKAFNKKIIITFHGFGNINNYLVKPLDKIIYRLANKIIVVNNEIAEILKLPKNKYLLRPAFLPPIMSKETLLPEYLINRINEAKSNNKLIICSNASRLNIFNNQDLYGLDMCIQLSLQLRDIGEKFLFVFNVSSLDEGYEMYKNAEETILKAKLCDHFILINENISFVKLIESANIVLRTTNTDGDAISVREALYLNKIVFASDIVERPNGTLLFKNRNHEDLFRKIMEHLINIKNKIINKEETNAQFIEHKIFYKTLIEKTIFSS